MQVITNSSIYNYVEIKIKLSIPNVFTQTVKLMSLI
jgi:hypothetical protein